MGTSESLEAKIRAELRKTGFPTEITSARVMETYGWGVLHSPSYLDDVERRSREFDLRAYQKWAVHQAGDSDTFDVLVYLIVECKRSDKPWVFFTTPQSHDAETEALLIRTRVSSPIFWSNMANTPSLIPFEELCDTHHYFMASRRARTYYEPLKGQEQADHGQAIYPAIMSATKATLFHQGTMPPLPLMIFYPLVIFNGLMFDAHVVTDDDIELQPVEYIQVAHHYIEPPNPRDGNNHPRQHDFIVDVVTPNYLRSYLMQLEREHQEIARRLHEPFAKGIFPRK